MVLCLFLCHRLAAAFECSQAIRFQQETETVRPSRSHVQRPYLGYDSTWGQRQDVAEPYTSS